MTRILSDEDTTRHLSYLIRYLVTLMLSTKKYHETLMLPNKVVLDTNLICSRYHVKVILSNEIRRDTDAIY